MSWRVSFGVTTRNSQPEETMEPLNLTIEGMSCEHCVRAVKNRLTRTPGVKVESVEVGSARVQYDPSATNIDDIEEAIADEGYTAYQA
jgi:copper chaperone